MSIFHPLRTCVVKEHVWSLQQRLSLHCDRQIVHKAQQHFEVIINCYLLLSKEEVNVFARVRLSVCLLARLLKNACMDLDELLQKLYNDKNSTQLKNTTYKTTNAQYTLIGNGRLLPTHRQWSTLSPVDTKGQSATVDFVHFQQS